MPFCENCGTKLDDDALFCSECGARVSGAAASPVMDNETYSWLRLETDHGEEEATAQSIRRALSAAAANEDEYAKLAPLAPGKGAVSILAYCVDTDSGELNLQIILNERKNRYDACYEKGGFSLGAACDIFLNYAKTQRLPADYPDWDQL